MTAQLDANRAPKRGSQQAQAEGSVRYVALCTEHGDWNC